MVFVLFQEMPPPKNPKKQMQHKKKTHVRFCQTFVYMYVSVRRLFTCTFLSDVCLHVVSLYNCVFVSVSESPSSFMCLDGKSCKY